MYICFPPSYRRTINRRPTFCPTVSTRVPGSTLINSFPLTIFTCNPTPYHLPKYLNNIYTHIIPPILSNLHHSPHRPHHYKQSLSLYLITTTTTNYYQQTPIEPDLKPVFGYGFPVEYNRNQPALFRCIYVVNNLDLRIPASANKHHSLSTLRNGNFFFFFFCFLHFSPFLVDHRLLFPPSIPRG
ncbi:uncharacterized protein F4822DRAFT_402978 [Hypoxylon trugodes]|uniref:uncharacterized protein n=1 Tax=Hypoxylon trugodes TaxID=326681 RepID=UPI0021917A7B|nr:uncharacterized protein F4822DRAFT_402978 [Hypoxylon trugodes]KAI1388490.1 hypothetical protein F4822DRAFT_402978 [Hypoxylon trugodes]